MPFNVRMSEGARPRVAVSAITESKAVGVHDLHRAAHARMLELDATRAAHMDRMLHRLRCPSLVLPCLMAVAVLLGARSSVAQPSPQPSTVGIKISLARSVPLVSACRNEAERQGASTKGLHSIEWDQTAHAEVMRSRSGSRVLSRASLTGWARSGRNWVPIIAQCKFDKGRPAVVSLEFQPTPLSGEGLDLSGISTLPEALAQPEAPLPSFPEPPPPTDPPEASTSSTTIAPIFQETPPVPPSITKDQDFLHDHRFGIELRTPF